ncbi:MAG: cysteine desulfurase family protein [Chloroflexota bacterium]|nr:cysteine desulfurase family protein [Chloroflexota bacterium]
MSAIYLDYNATTPVDPQVAEAMLPYVHGLFGNPSSSHGFGLAAREGVDLARSQVAEVLGCRLDELIFTSGGTEANNHAIKGVAFAHRNRGNHIVTSAVEHPAVTEVCRYLETHGFRVTYLPVYEYGLVDVSQLKEALTKETILVTIMHANNEVGSIQPIAEIAEAAHAVGALVHTDCAQSVGKIPVNVDELGVDLLSIAGHKLYAPKGIGALYIRNGVRLEKFMHGASHEQDRRAGTENVIEMVGLGAACSLIHQNLAEYASHMREMRDRLEGQLLDFGVDARINGHQDLRLPNTSSISFRGVEADRILANLPTVAASAGAACHSDRVELSHVLSAMAVPLDYAMGTIRFSVGRFTTAEEIELAVGELSQVIRKLATAPLSAQAG